MTTRTRTTASPNNGAGLQKATAQLFRFLSVTMPCWSVMTLSQTNNGMGGEVGSKRRRQHDSCIEQCNLFLKDRFLTFSASTELHTDWFVQILGEIKDGFFLLFLPIVPLCTSSLFCLLQREKRTFLSREPCFLSFIPSATKLVGRGLVVCGSYDEAGDVQKQ